MGLILPGGLNSGRTRVSRRAFRLIWRPISHKATWVGCTTLRLGTNSTTLFLEIRAWGYGVGLKASYPSRLHFSSTSIPAFSHPESQIILEGSKSYGKEALAEAKVFGSIETSLEANAAVKDAVSANTTAPKDRLGLLTNAEVTAFNPLAKKPNWKPQVIKANDFKFEGYKGLQLNRLATVKFGLDRCLFNPGVTFLQDPHSRVYNFDPYLQKIMDVRDFNFNKLGRYVPAERDEKLIQLARKHKKRYVTTTSSTTQLLCHLYYVISQWKPFDVSCLSAPFQRFSRQFSKTLTFPPSVILKKHGGGVYSINPDKSFDDDTKVLSQLGQVMERMLTMTPENFAKYKLEPQSVGRAQAIHQGLPTSELTAYNYTFTKGMVLRAQLDCVDPRLPRKVFDLKTRASLPIRLDQTNYKAYLSYDISSQLGVHESFEREYYDLIRSAFLKYNFQVRIGQMDGCLVAYHNTETLYGFQYVSLPEMDARLFDNSVMGEQAFANSLQLLENLLNEITTRYPEDEMLITLNTLEDSPLVQVYIEIFNKDKPKVETIPTAKASLATVDPFSRLAKFQLVCQSFVNGKKLVGPVSLSNTPGQDCWEVHYTLKEVKMDPLDLYNEYLMLRHTQATFYDFDKESLPLLQRIRATTAANETKPSIKSKPIVYKPTSYKY